MATPVTKLRLDRLAELMEQRGMRTQEDLARAAGLNGATIWKAIEGRIRIGNRFQSHLLWNAFPGVKWDDLFMVVDTDEDAEEEAEAA